MLSASRLRGTGPSLEKKQYTQTSVLLRRARTDNSYSEVLRLILTPSEAWIEKAVF